MAYAARVSPTPTDAVRAAASDEWSAATQHRLFREIVDDTVSDAHFERYLRIEFAFIDTAAIALGAAVRLAPDLADRRVLSAGLHDLLTSQVDFFEGALGDDHTAIVPPPAQDLHALYREVSDGGSYASLLAAMLAAEWLYETWCAETIGRPSTRPTIRAWTELHTDPAFTGHAAWLRSRLDALIPALDPGTSARVAGVYRATLAAEISFHDAVYLT
jgi:thiaminase/transcriptional activator TenA